jgi:hypothetical protein
VAQVVECLLFKHEVLNTNPSPDIPPQKTVLLATTIITRVVSAVKLEQRATLDSLQMTSHHEGRLPSF